jgi:hypothetical protein
MKRIIVVCSIVVVFILLTGLQACKKSSANLGPVRINYLDVRPQTIAEDETALITIMVTNVNEELVLVKTIADKGITNPQITSTTGNPVYVEYVPPDVPSNSTTEVVVTVAITDMEGRELDRAEARIMIVD